MKWLSCLCSAVHYPDFMRSLNPCGQGFFFCGVPVCLCMQFKNGIVHFHQTEQTRVEFSGCVFHLRRDGKIKEKAVIRKQGADYGSVCFHCSIYNQISRIVDRYMTGVYTQVITVRLTPFSQSQLIVIR